MRSFILAALLAAPLPLLAGDMLATNEAGDTVRLTQKPCSVAVLRVLPEGTRGVFREAIARVDGKEWRACWALTQNGLAHIVYPDGDQGLIPMAQFKQEPDA